MSRHSRVAAFERLSKSLDDAHLVDVNPYFIVGVLHETLRDATISSLESAVKVIDGAITARVNESRGKI